MNETEKKLYDYAQSVEWDFNEINKYIKNPNIGLTFKEYGDLEGFLSEDKATNFINKYKKKTNEVPNMDYSYKDVDTSMLDFKPTNEIKLSEFLFNPAMVTLPIEDYNRLRKLEIKAEIKKLKREYKKL